jgi:hypothetical protein
MTKDDMIGYLKSAGVNKDTIIAMSNAYDLGVEHERERCFFWVDWFVDEPYLDPTLEAIRSGDEIELNSENSH